MPSTPAGTDGEIALLYATTSTPANLADEADIAFYDEFLHQPPGITIESGTVFRMIDLRPGKATPMHRTVSVDFGIVIDGCVEVVLDSGESRKLGKGDVVVQRGTAHSFRNVSTVEWARLMFLFLPIERISVAGRVLEAEVYDEGFDRESGDEEGDNGEGKNVGQEGMGEG